MSITSQNKPIVHFDGEPHFWIWHDGKAEVANVYALDHPRLGRTGVRTSVVVKKFEDGSFETLNTLYVPLENKK